MRLTKIKIIHGVILVFVTCLDCFALEKQKSSLVVAFGQERVPYVLESKNTGIEVDLVRVVLKRMNYGMVPVYLSNKRVEAEVKNSEVQIGTSLPKSSSDLFYTSTPIVEFNNYVITHANDRIKMDSIADLKTAPSVCAWQNASITLSDKFNKAVDQHPGYREVPSLRSQVLLFLTGRCQAIVIDKTIFRWWTRVLNEDPYYDLILKSQIEKYSYHDLLGKSSQYVAFSNKKLRDEFEGSLQKVKQSMVYKKMIRKFLKMKS